MKNSVVIAGYKRTPFQLANKGAFIKTRPDDLAAAVVEDLLKVSGIDGAEIEDMILGCAFPEGEQGFNVARLVVNLAGLPITVAGTTVNRFCGSSMQAIHMAAGAIQMGSGHAFICGGLESMTRVPMGGFNPMPNPKLMESYPAAYMGMGQTAENLAKKYNISRQAQEEFALNSHQKAATAAKDGKFKDEITPIKTENGIIDSDGTIRADTSLETLATLKPAFDDTGTVTAGTSSPLTDGAGVALVTTEDFAKEHGLEILARVKSTAVSGCAAEIMGMGPVSATQKALERAGVTLSDIDIIELNEAFSAQALSVIGEMGMDINKVNLDGGAVALGHPLGVSGVRITAKAAQIMKREGKSPALATMCIGGGQGIATVLEGV
jgi:acetyl-CoA acyltransferase